MSYDALKHQALKKTLSIAFACTVAPAAAQGMVEKTPNALPPQTTYWKTEHLDMVLSVRPCEKQVVCGEIHWLNPEDEKIYEYFGDRKNRARQAGPHGGFDILPRATQDDIRALCGFSPKMDFRQVADNKWQGKIEIRGMGFTANMDVTAISKDELRVVTSKAIITQKETWRRVEENDPRYPKCVKPAPK